MERIHLNQKRPMLHHHRCPPRAESPVDQAKPSGRDWINWT
ncbi:hypothetical protein TPY_0474 [Sulfobacillus acidophilus TPY]|nr:hypothetical protein TPY_0474 [Sulfobacillus acidophilus TPY]